MVEVVEIYFGGGADTKVVNDEYEGGVVCVISDEAVRFRLVISVFFQKLFELNVREDTCLWQSIHATLNLDHHVTIVFDRVQVILINDFCWHFSDGNTSILVFLHQSAKIEIFYVDGIIMCAVCVNGVVEVTLDYGKTCDGSGAVAVIIDSVATNCQSHPLLLNFFG